MKPSLIAICLIVAGLCSCTTVSNRRDLYSPQTVMGPYTRMLHNGIPKHKTTVIKVQTSSSGKEYVKPIKS